jgi:serine phosphatase RsbU (regulator of sigma subunit)
MKIRDLWRKGLEFVLNVGADPADDDYTRTIKRIYWVTAAFGILASFGSTIWYFLAGSAVMGWIFLLSFLFFVGTFIDGVRHPRHFRGITLAVLIYFVAGSVLSTILLGGIWKTDGAIIVGLMGPLLGLIYFRNRRFAMALFIVYCALVMGLAIFEPALEGPMPRALGLDPVMFWLGFVVVAAFIFGEIYFFVVQRDKAHRELAEEKDRSEALLRRIEADLEQAARIQKALLPKSSPSLAGFDISGLNVPCYEIGGDYFDFVPIDADRIGLVIADVSGKGISASLLMASLRAALLAEIHPGYELGRLAARLNDFVFKSTGPTDFVTFVFAQIDRRTQELFYVNAGHNPPFVLVREAGMASLEASGLPLGMFAGADYECRTFPFRPGDMVVLYTDGIPDGRNPKGEDYTEDRLKRVVVTNAALSSFKICRKVIDDVGDYACGTQPCDDMTLVVVKRAET